MASGRKLETKYLKLFIKLGENEKPRIGIALSSKNFKKATDRNRAKRVTAQAFQSIYSTLPNNINIVALPKSGVLDVKSGDLSLDLEEVLIKERVILSD